MKFAFLKQNTKFENEYLIGKKIALQVRKFLCGDETFVRRKFCSSSSSRAKEGKEDMMNLLNIL